MVNVTGSPTLRTIPFLIAAGPCERSAAIRFRMGVATAALLLAIVSTATAKYSGGSGTAWDPYQIAAAADLIALGETPADYDKHFLLTADIDLDPKLPGGKVFDKAVIAPVPTAANVTWGDFVGPSFTGVFDGNGHTISHLTIKGNSCLGLFGQSGAWYAAVGEIQDLGVMDVNITGSGNHVGGLVGYNDGGSASRCYSTGAVMGTGWDVGGLVGGNWGTASQCYSTGSVSGGVDVGGLVGYNGATVAQCYSTGAVIGTGWDVGGLVGGNNGSVRHCYSTGAVSGTNAVGGLVGMNTIGPTPSGL